MEDKDKKYILKIKYDPIIKDLVFYYNWINIWKINDNKTIEMLDGIN